MTRLEMMKLLPSKGARRRLAAFSIMESIVGFAILGSTGLALLSGISGGFFTLRLARENLRATQIMLEKVETIRLYSWTQINTPGFIPNSFTNYYDPNNPGSPGTMYVGTLAISPVPDTAVSSSYRTSMRQVTVQINWQTGRLNRSRTFTSYISRYGLQDYIY